METSTHQDKLIDRVRKIFALAADSAAHEGEREAAMEAAQRIMLEHGLDMASIEESKRDDGVAQNVLDMEFSYWESELVWAIARASFCKGWRHTTGKAHIWTLVGRPEHVRFVREMFAYLRQQAEGEVTQKLARMDKRAQYARLFVQRINVNNPNLERLLNHESSDEDWKRGILYAKIELRKAEDSAQLIADTCEIAWNYGAEVRAYVNRGDLAPAFVPNLGVYRRSFLSAFAARVNTRLEEMQASTVDEMGEKGTDLVFNEWTQVQAWMDANAPKLEENTSERKWSAAGLTDGRDAGDRADLSTRNKVSTTRGELTA
jgi:hypothetical protein